MNVALYCRVSTDEQRRTGESILDQQTALERWAAEHGHRVAGIYSDEGYSAHRQYKKRPALMRLLTDIERGEIELIAFTKFDRWTRRAADYYELQEQLDRNKVPWTAILEDYETVTADGRFKVGIMLSVNQHEAERTSERIRFTFAEKRRRGELISGNLPRGYRVQDGKPVKDPDTGQAVAAFWKTYLSGRGLNAALLAAESRGLRLAVSSGSFMLRNAKAYTGQIQGVSCDPYITDEEAERVLATRKSKARGSGTVYLFRGMCYCSECGGLMAAHRNTYKRKDGNGIQIFYNCSRRYRSIGRDCQNCVNIYETDIEEELLRKLDAEISAEADRLQIRIDAEQKCQDNREENEHIRQRLESRRARAWDAYLAGAASIEQYKKEQERINAELERLEPVYQTAPDAAERLRNALDANWRELYRQLDRSHRHQFWARMVERIEITPEREVLLLLRSII